MGPRGVVPVGPRGVPQGRACRAQGRRCGRVQSSHRPSGPRTRRARVGGAAGMIWFIPTLAQLRAPATLIRATRPDGRRDPIGRSRSVTRPRRLSERPSGRRPRDRQPQALGRLRRPQRPALRRRAGPVEPAACAHRDRCPRGAGRGRAAGGAAARAGRRDSGPTAALRDPGAPQGHPVHRARPARAGAGHTALRGAARPAAAGRPPRPGAHQQPQGPPVRRGRSPAGRCPPGLARPGPD